MDSTADDPAASSGTCINFLDLPDCMIEQVLEYLSYDEIAKKRIVCRKIDRICQSLLNRGFIKMIRKHNMNLKAIKSQLPRRESERRNHPLSKHSDILTCIETRISMLSMTYSKFIEKELCCFIPGKVIDEVLNILGLIENTSRPLRAHEVLQELRDISSMAIEHFDENIAHRLKKIIGVQHHPKLGSHHNLPFPAAAFIQHEVMLPCDVNGDKFVIPTLTPISPKSQKALPSSTSSAGSSSPSPSSSSTSGSLAGLYCQSSYNASCENNASIARINHKTRKMRYDINRIDHTISSFKAEMRSMRLLLVRYGGEMKELRRRLEESETKNLELLANINQLGFGAPSVGGSERSESAAAAATIKQCSIKPRPSASMLKRLYTDTESHSSSSPVVPSSSSTSSSPKEMKEANTEAEEHEAADGSSSAKKVKLTDLLQVGAERVNEFDVIKDCKQYNTELGYNGALNYFPTSSLKNTVDQGEFKYYTIGVLGPNDGVIRLAHSVYPYGTEVVEVGGYNNTKTIGRHQYRKSSGEFNNTDIVKMATPNLLSPFRPVMLKLKLWTNGKREVFHYGHQFPFISFTDARNNYSLLLTSMATMIHGAFLIFIAITLLHFGAGSVNEFDVIKDCKQYNTELGYNDPLEYFPTNTLNNTVDHGEFKYYKIGVLGTNDGVIRFSHHVYPYDKDVIEVGAN
uniref:F-box domain-containing protein n=1 Tax=Anopheles christyi TaxID=43041 RepID=A0A182JZ87_9DIPT